MTVSITDALRPEPVPIVERPPLDVRLLASVAVLAIPAALVATRALLPWARRIQPTQWPTAEGVAMAPVILAVLALIAVAYRPYLSAYVVDHRGAKVVRGIDLGRGFAATWCAPVVAVFFAAAGGGRIWSTLAVAGGWAIAVLYSLERDRRRAPDRRLRWTDPLLEQIRLRPWGAVACAIVGSAMIAELALDDFDGDPLAPLTLGGYVAFFSLVAPFTFAFDALRRDGATEGPLEMAVVLGMGAASLMILGALRRADGVPAFAWSVLLAVILVVGTEFVRRRMRARRIAELSREGHADDLAGSYGWRVPRAQAPGA